MELADCSADADSVLKGPAISISDVPLTKDPGPLPHSSGPKSENSETQVAPTEQESETLLNSPSLRPTTDDELVAPHELADSSDEEWEDESLYEEALEGLADGTPHGLRSLDVCTLPESTEFRKQLRALGAEKFVEDTVFSGKITAKKLCTAFGILPPAFLDGCPDEAYYQLLGMGISRELQKRVKLPQYNTLDDAIALLKQAQKIIVLTGAGISTSLGIPDFRSTDTGLYTRLAAKGLSEPEEVFDIHVFREDPSVFYSIAKDILPPTSSEGKIQYTPTHAFIRLLQDKGKLLTNYTQNIDNIEEAAGIERDNLIQCHGSFARATCQECHHQVSGETIYPQIRRAVVPSCEKCVERLEASGTKRKRDITPNRPSKRRNWDVLSQSDGDDEDYTIAAAGVMKPDITFFGEALPATFHDRIIDHDRDQADLVIVIGTSLKVAPVAEVPGILPPNVPQIYINKTRCTHVDFDIEMRGDCDLVIAELVRRAGWDLPLYERKAPQKCKVELLEDSQHQWMFASEEQDN